MPNYYDGIAITKQLLFGVVDVPADFNERIRPSDADSPIFAVDADLYMTDGAGRYGWPSRANLVEKFFANSDSLQSGDYTLAELVDALELIGVAANLLGDVIIPIDNYNLDVDSDDWIERAYIFGSSQATLKEATFHISADGTATISDIVIQPDNDNFDYSSGNGAAQLVNDLVLKPTLDPYGLGSPEVNIVFSQASALTFGGDGVYTRAMFEADETKETELEATLTYSAIAGLISGSTYLNNYLKGDPILNYELEV